MSSRMNVHEFARKLVDNAPEFARLYHFLGVQDFDEWCDAFRIWMANGCQEPTGLQNCRIFQFRYDDGTADSASVGDAAQAIRIGRSMSDCYQVDEFVQDPEHPDTTVAKMIWKRE